MNPASYAAASRKLNYLSPMAHGSAAQMLDFGRECVASATWKGRVPLILADAHSLLAQQANADYYNDPKVWTDIQSSYEKFFALNPLEVRWRHNYALAAYRCSQWDEFNRQRALLTATNYAFFGGKEAWDRMIITAEKAAPRP